MRFGQWWRSTPAWSGSRSSGTAWAASSTDTRQVGGNCQDRWLIIWYGQACSMGWSWRRHAAKQEVVLRLLPRAWGRLSRWSEGVKERLERGREPHTPMSHMLPAAGRMFDPRTRTICGLRPCHFVTMATPHLGCDGDTTPAQVCWQAGQLMDVWSWARGAEWFQSITWAAVAKN